MESFQVMCYNKSQYHLRKRNTGRREMVCMANFTQKAILETFEEMLREKPFDKITVTALVERCGISSNTFYYHYHDIFDLLDAWIKEKFSQYTDDGYMGDNWIRTVKQILSEMRQNKEIVWHIYWSISRERLERYLFDTVEADVFRVIKRRAEGKQVPEETLRLLTGMCCYTMVGFFMKYVWSGMPNEEEEYVDRLGELLEKCMNLYLETV